MYKFYKPIPLSPFLILILILNICNLNLSTVFSEQLGSNSMYKKKAQFGGGFFYVKFHLFCLHNIFTII